MPYAASIVLRASFQALFSFHLVRDECIERLKSSMVRSRAGDEQNHLFCMSKFRHCVPCAGLY